MRKHGWQLPYHPLQVCLLFDVVLRFSCFLFLLVKLVWVLEVVAVAVFLALAFAFYVFFAPFVGKKLFQYIAMGIYTPLILCVFGLYIWCAAADPADPGVFKSKKYLKKVKGKGMPPKLKDSKLGAESTSSIHGANVEKSVDKDGVVIDTASKDLPIECEKPSTEQSLCYLGQLVLLPCACLCRRCMSNKEHSEQQMSEDGMFYCSLCEVEVFKYSKHCRVCDKCVDCFDHHCRWLNNCIGKRNYRQFFTLMIFSILLLIIQWATGILVLVCCFLEQKRFKLDISTKLGSSFTLVPFVIVVVVCTILAMIATLPLAQLFFFHILLIKKGISTYDYIIALREQELDQQGGGPQSPQMSPVSSLTGLSSASSFSTFRRGAWCTPPRLFLEDQFDVVPPETASVSSMGKKSVADEPVRKKNPAAVKISPWTLARLNAEEISKVAAEARKKSKILQPVVRQDSQFGLERENSFGSSGRRMVPRIDSNRRRANKRVRLPAELPMESLAKNSAKVVNKGFTGSSSSLAPLQLEALSAFQTSQAMTSSVGIVASSPESSLDSPDIHPFRLSSEAEEARRLTVLPPLGITSTGIPFSRSTSDGYEASGGEDSDRVPSRIVQRPTDWSNLLFGPDQTGSIVKLKAPSSSGLLNNRRL